MTTLTIIRGLPGSGKSTLARTFLASWFEADQFMVDEDGKYAFSADKLKECHERCFLSAERVIETGCDAVVANTFVRLWEMKRYVDMAKRLGATINIILCQGRFQNVHGVPEEKIQQMKERFEYDVSSLF